MEHTTLCLNLSLNYDLPLDRQARILKDTGFDGFFTPWNPKRYAVSDMCRTAKELGLLYQSVHGPTKGVWLMWEEGEAGDAAAAELMAAVEDCGRNEIPILISHTYRTFDPHPITQVGLDRYGSLVRRAGELGLRFAFENTEGKHQLAALLNAFGSEPAAAFCWDSGHELCYDHGEDLLARYGKYLICTHLNDNLGVRDHDGTIGGHDDLHLLPFDGIGDWENIVSRLNDWNYHGPLTFELKKVNHPFRHESDGYGLMTMERYFAECYMRACRVAALKARDWRNRT